jgi:HemY protein
MRRALVILLACIIVIAATLWVAALPGAVRFEAGSLSVDAATPTLVFVGLLVLLLFYLVVRGLGALIRLPRRVRLARAQRRRRLGDMAVTRTLVALAAENQRDALTESQRARKLLGDTPHTLLIAAQAERLAKHDAEATTLYTNLAQHPDASLLGLRGLLGQAIAREDWTEAESVADRAERAHPNSVWLRGQRARLVARDGDLAAALRLVGPHAATGAETAAAAALTDDDAEGLKLARAAFMADPALTQAALAYAARLRATGSERKALAVLQRGWDARPHPDLAVAALQTIEDAAARETAAKRLTEHTRKNPESQMLLARTALDAGDLTAARDAADLVKPLNQQRAWRLVADVENRIHPESAAVRAAWQRAAAADPDPSWRCNACSQRQPRWSGKCSHCGRAGSLVWE